MQYGITNVQIMPLRATASDKSEMTSQLLFGELFEIIDASKSWAYIRNLYDDYEGWADKKQFIILPTNEANRLINSEVNYTNEWISRAYSLTAKQEFAFVLGSHLNGLKNGKIRINENEFIVRESPLSFKIEKTQASILLNSKKFIGAPYLWGGKTPFGVDCSGFTQTVFKLCGIKLLRDAAQQSLQGVGVDFIDDAECGDLAFFDNDEDDIIHVGILLNNSKIIHSSGFVRIDSIDHNGIFNEDIGDYSHKLRIIKRFL
ncbi:MAG: hypothetical protein AUJ98_07645 [Bacteroidetes bacterium CG2_30_33_31]|nr:MAG: hypothetical protein AUJ98_07645 [Bacteroidetes bacterium CG2_30_33_31]